MTQDLQNETSTDVPTDVPTAVLARLEAFYDALPRGDARAEELGSLRLFVREGEGWPFYARPASTSGRGDTGDLRDADGATGLAAAVTSVLAAEALRRGRSTVFLSAQDDDVARVYERVGFRRVGTAGLAEPK